MFSLETIADAKTCANDFAAVKRLLDALNELDTAIVSARDLIAEQSSMNMGDLQGCLADLIGDMRPLYEQLDQDLREWETVECYGKPVGAEAGGEFRRRGK